MTLGAAAASGQSAGAEVSLSPGGSAIIESPADIIRISTSDPSVVDTVGVSAREVLLQGKGYGLATVGVWSKSGSRVFNKVTVLQDLEPLRKLFRQTFPDEVIEDG